MGSRRRTTRSSQLSPDFHGLLENLHSTSSQNQSSQKCLAPEHSTLAEASNQDVDKLLDRAGARGVAAKERTAGAKNAVCGKRGRKCAFPEGEDNLFYQRKVQNDNISSRNTVICGATASSLGDVKYGSSNGEGSAQAAINQSTKKMGLGTTAVSENTDTPSKCFGVEGDDATPQECSIMDDGCEWEHESTVVASTSQEDDKVWDGEISIEVEINTPDTMEKKTVKRVVRRASVKDKEFAELVHKTHLLCMIARGRLVDAACDNPILQASLLSIVPGHIHFQDTEQIPAADLGPLVKWFQSVFQICSDQDSTPAQISGKDDDFTSCLLQAFHKQAGSIEEVAALSVSLLRALGFTVRYVTVLDVLSLKPDASSLEASIDWDLSSAVEDRYSQQLLGRRLATSLGQAFVYCTAPSLASSFTNAGSSPIASSLEATRMQGRRGGKNQGIQLPSPNGKEKVLESPNLAGHAMQAGSPKELKARENSGLHSCNSEGREDYTNIETNISEEQQVEKGVKRKGDIEFELQLAMAMAATAGREGNTNVSDGREYSEEPSDITPSKRSRSSANKDKAGDNNKAHAMTSGGAVWSRKWGPLLHWSEVYCKGKDGGRWVHIDAVRGLLDCADMVESGARACKVPLRYVLAFAGHGAKDVTRRYVSLWSSIAPLRLGSEWWNATLEPLKQLEMAATSGSLCKVNPSDCSELAAAELKQEVDLSKEGPLIARGRTSSYSSCKVGSSSQLWSRMNDRASLEDMELDIRSCTEPLPQNQQAYKTHHLYVLERWLTKYQALHPRGPVLGYCAGQPVFPRACVQNLHTADRWLREGLKVKASETPAKILKNPRLTNRATNNSYDAEGGSNEAPTTPLYGEWQTEPWHPPPAVGGIVPKNERGNVELWSEKCLPAGTVHISLPRILPIAKKLEIDFAPALVGFEIRNRKSVPIFEGIVVCQEHEVVLLEAYAEEELRRNAEAEKKRESLAIARWCQLLRVVVTRQRLQATYKTSEEGPIPELSSNNCKAPTALSSENPAGVEADASDVGKSALNTAHEHMFPEEFQSFDEQTGICTKVCQCGFTLEVEEM